MVFSRLNRKSQGTVMYALVLIIFNSTGNGNRTGTFNILTRVRRENEQFYSNIRSFPIYWDTTRTLSERTNLLDKSLLSKRVGQSSGMTNPIHVWMAAYQSVIKAIGHNMGKREKESDMCRQGW